jgi:Helix-turn-helix domain
MAVAPARASDSPFPGWEPFVPRLVHPIKIAVVEVLLSVGKPLSAAQIAQRLRQAGLRVGDSNLRYHLNHLVEIGLLKLVSAPPDADEHAKANFYDFTGPGARL